MKKIILSTVACATMLLAANNDYKYEITPMFTTAISESNTNMDGSHALGLALGFNQSEDSMFDQLEIGFMRGITNLTDVGDEHASRIFANWIKEYPLSSNYTLYGLVGAGVELFNSGFDDNEDGLFGNYGAGLKIRIYDDINMKVDLRHAIETDRGDNTLLYNIGLAIPFGKISKPAPAVVPAPVVETPKDSDNDGVIDANDKCPNSVPNAVVNAMGCEMDDDKDGVVNRLDQCPNTISGAKVDTVGCMTLVDLNINFDTNSANIKPSYNSKIVEFANVMKNNTKLKATIEAHTDSVGSAKYNQKLSEKRAASTVEALKALNVDGSRLNAVGYGESKPVATNKTKEGRAENRRVTAVINK